MSRHPDLRSRGAQYPVRGTGHDVLPNMPLAWKEKDSFRNVWACSENIPSLVNEIVDVLCFVHIYILIHPQACEPLDTDWKFSVYASHNEFLPLLHGEGLYK